MNSQGLTEVVVLSIGLRAGILDHRLYSLMVVMALATTAMTGPLLSAIRAAPSALRWRGLARVVVLDQRAPSAPATGVPAGHSATALTPPEGPFP